MTISQIVDTEAIYRVAVQQLRSQVEPVNAESYRAKLRAQHVRLGYIGPQFAEVRRRDYDALDLMLSELVRPAASQPPQTGR